MTNDFFRENKRWPSGILIIPANLIADAEQRHLVPGVLLIDSATGEKNYSQFGKYADDWRKKWEEYEIGGTK